MKNKKLKILLESIFRPKARIAGGLVESLKREISKNNLSDANSHITKAREVIISIENINKMESLSLEEKKGLEKISSLLQGLLSNVKK